MISRVVSLMILATGIVAMLVAAAMADAGTKPLGCTLAPAVLNVSNGITNVARTIK